MNEGETDALWNFFNPNAGDGDAEELAKKMREKFEQAGHSADFLTAPDQAIEEVKSALDDHDGIVAIGGDGSLNIVGTAFVQSGKSLPLGIIPGGPSTISQNGGICQWMRRPQWM